jgi:alkylation response protein AidB-like acyl-CoA dehydrogenase
MGKSDPNNSNAYHQQSVVIVPADTSGVKVIRPMMVFGYDHAPEGHCEVVYENVRVPLGNLVYGWGKGFEVSAIETACGVCCSQLSDCSRTARVCVPSFEHLRVI